MNHHTPNSSRNRRTLIASLLAYLMLTSQLTPVAFALNRAGLRSDSKRQTEAMRKQSNPSMVVSANVPAAVPLPAPAPGGATSLTATKTDMYPSQPGPAVPGETLTYSITITNTGGTDATNVTLTDTVDPNTTIVPGSPGSTPIAFNDAYNVIGNVRIQPNAAQGVLANDINPNTGNNSGLTASGPTTSTQGGDVIVNADGSFSYNPPVGFTGTDTFTYTATSTSGPQTATVTLTVAGMIFFVNDDATPGGDGRLTNPFNCLVGSGCFTDSTADEGGDNIFLFNGAYTGGLTLLSNQKLIGQGASDTLANIAGIVTVEPYSDPLPVTSANPANVTITTTLPATNAIVVSSGGITLRGFTVGNTTGSKISGGAFGTLTAGNNVTPDLTLNGSGKALDLNGGTFAATSAFTSVSTTSSSSQGIQLTSVSGTVALGSTTVSNSTTQGILVNTSFANINFGNTSVTGGTDGISLQNNTVGTRTFGTLSISNNTGVGFLHAVGGGATTINGATTITNPGGVGIQISQSNAAISFAATSVDKGTTAGIAVSITSNAGQTTTFSSLDINAQESGLFATTGGTINVTNAAGSEITAPQLIDINVATLGLNFTNLISNSGPASIPALRIIGAGGSLNNTTTNIQNAGNFGMTLDNNSAAFNFGNTTVNSSAGTGVFLNANTGAVTFADLDITPDSNQPALHATNNTGTITSSSGDITATTSVAIDIAGASAAARTPLSMTLDNVSSSNSASASGGVNLNFVSGNLTVTGAGTDTNITNPNGFGIQVRNTGAGTINFGDTVVSASGGTGVILGTASNGNTGAITFGDLDISPDNGQRALHSQASTGTITIVSGTIITNAVAAGGSNVGIEIVGPSAASRTPINITFDSVSVNNALNGIVLTNTSDGGNAFRILGTGSTDGSGGSITNITNRGASFINADDIALNNMNFTTVGTANGADPTSASSTCGDLGPAGGGNAGCNAGVHFDTVIGAALTNLDMNGGNQVGVNGNSVTNFSLTNSNVLNFGDQVREDGLKFRNMLGTSSITGTTISANEAVQVHVENLSGTLTGLTVMNSTISTSAAPNGSHGILFDTHNTATAKLTVQGVTFLNLFSNCIDVLGDGSSGGLEVVVNGDLTGASLRNSFTGCGASGITIAQNGAAPVAFNIFNNGTSGSPTFLGGTSSSAININQAGSATAAAIMQGAITNNFIGNNSSPTSSTVGGDGITAATIAPGTLTVAINNNTIRGVGTNGIRVQMREDTAASHRLNLTLLNNNVLVTNDPNAFDGIHVVAGTLAGDAGILCAEINNNDAGTIAAGNDFVVRQRFVTTFQLRGYAGANNDNAAVQTFLDVNQANDPVGPGNDWFITNNVAGGGGGFVNTPGGAQCTQPVLPTTPETFDEIVSPGGIPVRGNSEEATEQKPNNDSITSRPFVSSPREQRAAMMKTAVAGVAAKPIVIQAVASEAKKQTPQSKPADRTLPNPPVVMGDTLTWNVGTLPAGQSVTITFQVVVDNPYGGGPNVSNQGTVTADGGISVLTDDPDVPGLNNPTLTPIATPANVFIRDGRAAEPTAGSTNMLFTVALSAPASGPVSVDFATADQAPGPGHAVAGVDYTATSGTVNFMAGEQIKTIPVPVLADGDNSESDETFLVNLSNAMNATIADGQAIGTITVTNQPGTVVISELRTFGPGAANDPTDEFVEIYNNTDLAITVPAGGYGLFKMGATCDATPILVGTIPATTVIPARGHFLFTGATYSLNNYGGTGAAAGDAALTADIENNANIALFSTSDVSQISSENRLDAVGFGVQTSGNCALLLEGNSLAPLTTNLTTLGQHAFVRDTCGKGGSITTFGVCPTNGFPKDSNDNAADFFFVDINGTNAGAGQRLGTAGPENLTSPIRLDGTTTMVLVDSTVAASAPPNRVRDFTSDPANNSTFGTLSIRRRFVNTTASPITRLRIRVIDVTTFPAPAGIADLRSRTSVDVTGVTVNDTGTCAATGTPTTPPCTVTIRGTTLEQPPAQPNGGGFNSTLSAGTVTTITPVAPGASINLQFLLGVQQTGSFKFFLIIEALP